MNKFTKLLSVFVIAGAVGTGIAGVAGCTEKKPSHSHDYQYTINATDSTKHDGHCAKDGCDKPDITEVHHWGTDNKCKECPATKPAEEGDKYEVPANVSGLIIKDYGDASVTLSSTKTAHSITKSSVKVLFNTGSSASPVEGAEVPAANLVLELKDPSMRDVTDWTDLRTDGTYTLAAKLKDCKLAAGAPTGLTVEMITANATITVSNPVQAGSLAVKTGEGVKTTQQQSSTNEILPTWTFEVTLANGDKKDVPTSEVQVSGLDTTKITDSGVATLTWGEVTGTQSYTITENESLVAQSYAVNFGELTDEQKTKLKTEDVSIQDGRFVVQATSGEVADHRSSAPDYEGKYLASRLKMGGKYDGDNAKRYVKITTEGEATITVYAYANSGTEGAGESGRFLSLYQNVTYGPKGGTDESKIVGTAAGLIGTKQNTLQKENSTHTFSVTEAGTYWLVCESGDVCITYIQVDQLVAKGEGVVARPLPAGETKLVKLSVKSETKDYKQTFTVGDNFSVSDEYSYEGVYYNTVTMAKVSAGAVTEGITYWLGNTQLTTDTVLTADMFDILGEQKITVKVDGETETAQYTIVVESAVPGVTGISASIKDTVNTILANASAKLTLNKTDIEAAIVGENENATLNITAVKYRAKDAEAGTETEITESVELGVGEYVIVVVANVADATANKNADFEATVALKVSVEGNGASWLYQTENSTVGESNPDIAKDAVIDNNGSFTAKALVAAKSGYNQNNAFGTNVTASVPKAAAEKTASGEEITFTNAVAFGTKGSADGVEYLEITAKKATTIYVYLTCSDDGHKSNRAGASVYYSINGTACAEADEVAVTNRTETTVLKVELAEGDVLKVGVKKASASADPRVWLYGIEAVDVVAD